MKDSKYSVWRVLRFQMAFVKQEGKFHLYFILVMESIVFGIIPILMVLFPGLVVDAVNNQNMHDLYLYSGLFAGSIMVLYSLHHYMNSIINSDLLGLRFLAGKRYNENYLSADYKYLEDPEFQAKRSSSLQALRGGNVGFEGLYRFYLRITTGVISLVGLFYIVGMINIWIIVLSIVLAILQYYITLIAKNHSFTFRDELNERLRKAFYFFKIGHDFSYGKDIRVDQMDHALIRKYKEKSTEYLGLFKRLEFYEMRLNLFNVLFMLIMNGATYYIVIVSYFNNVLTIGQFTMTIWAITEISVLLQSLFTVLASVKKESGHVSDYMSFLEDESYFPQQSGVKRDLSDFRIEFKDVSFQYPASDVYVLQHLNLTISSKEKLALVGINGAGKSTIVKLLCGFYQPTSGDIFIDGYNIKDLDITAYRNQISVVFQDVNIYAATVLENIIGDEYTATNKQNAMRALDMVGLTEKVSSYPYQENQPLLKVIDDHGTDLSGGEAQRLAIARAIYKDNTNFIVLDEPTASLDAIREKEIYENFKELIQNRTSIIISHRLASTRFCDHIAFLENGTIIEYGTHDELMNITEGKYKEMFITQGKYYQEEGVSHA